jgi:formamidopyrimidine-DNA glycosylase
MPELPEVETTVRELNKKVRGWTFVDTWSDSKKQIKEPKSFEQFKKRIKGKKIKKVRRRAKYIIFDLSENSSLLVHQKISGHLLVGEWKFKDGKWVCANKFLSDRTNRYIHILFTFSNGKMLTLSDLRKFGWVKLLNKEELERELSFLGPEPLEEDFTFEKFKEILGNRRGKIKSILMNQKIIAGIGNIYSDEILWKAKIHPTKDTSRLSKRELKRIFEAMKKILRQALELKGTSISDYRRPSGKKGYYAEKRKVYRREGEECSRCGGKIKRIKISGRSAHFCSKCQKL